MTNRSLCIIFTLLFGGSNFNDGANAQGFRLKISKTTNGFHIPVSLSGQTIIVTPPENEHVVYAIEDMLSAAKIQNDRCHAGLCRRATA